MDERTRTLLSVFHIPWLARNLIYVSKTSDASVRIMFENDTCRMVQGEMVLLRGFHIGTLYKLLVRRTISDGCDSFIIPKSGTKEGKNSTTFGERTKLWHQTL